MIKSRDRRLRERRRQDSNKCSGGSDQKLKKRSGIRGGGWIERRRRCEGVQEREEENQAGEEGEELYMSEGEDGRQCIKWRRKETGRTRKVTIEKAEKKVRRGWQANY